MSTYEIVIECGPDLSVPASPYYHYFRSEDGTESTVFPASLPSRDMHDMTTDARGREMSHAGTIVVLTEHADDDDRVTRAAFDYFEGRPSRDFDIVKLNWFGPELEVIIVREGTIHYPCIGVWASIGNELAFLPLPLSLKPFVAG